jgi:serine/threonine protein kinase
MPEPHPQPDPDGRVHPTDDLTRSVSDPNFTSGDETTTAPSAVPTLAFQSYTLLEEIARDGMGVIWRATDTALDREVAVKLLQDKFGPDFGVARRFAEEARITAQLQHPAMPPVHDLGTLSDGRPFLAMKLIKGHPLDELLAARPDPSAERGCSWRCSSRCARRSLMLTRMT